MNSLTPENHMYLMVQIRAVKRHFPFMDFYYENSESAYIEGSVEAGPSRQPCTLRMYFNPRLPEVCPSLYVWDPVMLSRKPTGTVNECGGSHAYHTAKLGPGNRVGICHTPRSSWDPSIAYFQVMLKGMLWLDFYYMHLDTGNDIDFYFRNLKRTAQQSPR